MAMSTTSTPAAIPRPTQRGVVGQGVAQAQALGQVLAHTPFDRAVCSNYPRTRQTLDQLLGGRVQPVEERAGFREIRAGRLREIPRENLHREVGQAYQLADRPAPALRRAAKRPRSSNAVRRFQQLRKAPELGRQHLVATCR